jgi:colanic acid/amylovoran biosynthesis glycosyltransferase
MSLLSFSETFIRSQASAMKAFKPFYVGIRKIAGLELPAESSWIANHGGPAGLGHEMRFRFLGPSANCVTRLTSLRPKLIHAHFGADACEAIPLANALSLPLIATFHGYDATCSDQGLRQNRHGRTYLRNRHLLHKKASLFIAVSEYIAKRVKEQGIPSEKIRVHYIGVDVGYFRPADDSVRKRTVLFVGRLVEKKGCSFLLKAMSEVENALPDVDVVVIGDGPERENLEKQAQQSLRKYRFLGVQSPSAVKEWMQKASVLCVPSVTAANGDVEGLGMVFAEANACGLPVVTFASGGTEEAIAHGETGFLAPERDWRQLSEYLLLLFRNKDLLKQFSAAGRHRAMQRFDLQKQTAGLERIYEEVIASHRAAEGRLAQ